MIYRLQKKYNMFNQMIKNLSIDQPLRWLGGFIIGASLIFVGISWDFFITNQRWNTELQRSIKIETLRGTIIHLDEVLTMSVRLAAATGDLSWEKRYREHEPKLDQAIKSLEKIAPEIYSREAIQKTDVANMKLVEMENRSFEFTRRGLLKEAQDILFSQEYEEQKKIYAEGMLYFSNPYHSEVSFEQLRGKVIHYDEVLTMTAKMAALSGDFALNKRYEEYALKLKEVLDDLFRVASDQYIRQIIEQMEMVSKRLIGTGEMTFTLIHSNQQDQANQNLSSREYGQDKVRFKQLANDLFEHAYQGPQKILTGNIGRISVHLVIIIFILSALTVIWFIILKALKQWQAALLESNENLNQQTQRLTELNQTLDMKVQERTKQIKRQQTATLNILQDVKKAKEDAEQAQQQLSNAHQEVKKSYEQLKQTQSQLFQSEKLASIGQLAAGVAHEINNPVGFISNNMEILQEYIQNYTKILRIIDNLKRQIEDGDIEKARSTIAELKKFEEEINLDYIMNDVNTLLEHSSRGLERIRKIVMDLRTFAREENAETMELVKIEEIIDSILSIVQSEIKYKAELSKEYTDTPLIKGNAQRLGQVFINLLVNASQSIEEKGKITIKTYRQDKFVCIDVVDTGKGISPENMKKIFDPFFTTKPVGQGTGLGLSVSYEIVKKHGGEIKVQSKVGEGTTFTVKVPTG